MTTSTVVPIKQPVPETINGPEQALRIVLLDPDSRCPETSYALGHYDGYLAGIFWTWGGGGAFPDDERAEQHAKAYASDLAPMPFGVALAARPHFTSDRDLNTGGYPTAKLRIIGWLEGWKVATADEPEADECAACGRRLFDELDDVWRCLLDGVSLCARGCDEAVCTGPRHNRECREDSL